MYSIFIFAVLFGFWIILSGMLDVFHLTLGVLSCLLVSFISYDLFVIDKSNKRWFAETAVFIAAYIPYLLKEIVLSTIHVSILALHPRMKELISPQIVRFKTTLKRDISVVVLANSITLTPGTITIRVKEGEFYVHALTGRLAEGVPGGMEEKVGRVFGEVR